jgi:capsular polysaccharide export protein
VGLRRRLITGVATLPYRWGKMQMARRGKTPSGKPPIFLFGFSKWKVFIKEWFPDHIVIHAPVKISNLEFNLRWRYRILSDPRSTVYTWQYKGPSAIKEFCKRNKVDFAFVEDGFIRSVSIGALHTPPMSLAFDKQDMYFNAQSKTDLEDLLAHYPFKDDPALMARAEKCMNDLLEMRLSKYNMGETVEIEKIYGPKDRKRVLVVGQVERDASIQYGCSLRLKNNDLVRLAYEENPDAQIIYKPHPEVLHGTASPLSDPAEVRGICQILTQDISLADSFDTIDHVYTITSLSGFEALMRGLKVTTLGCPFYAGWGLTDDRQPNPRRHRALSVTEVFAAAYILYPRYFDPISQTSIDIEDAISILYSLRTKKEMERAVSI